MYIYKTSSQAPSYARSVQSETIAYSLTHLLTGVKCRATSVAKNYKKSSRVDAPQAMTIDSAPIQTGGI